jgi:Mce-associated membrane protein
MTDPSPPPGQPGKPGLPGGDEPDGDKPDTALPGGAPPRDLPGEAGPDERQLDSFAAEPEPEPEPVVPAESVAGSEVPEVPETLVDEPPARPAEPEPNPAPARPAEPENPPPVAEPGVPGAAGAHEPQLDSFAAEPEPRHPAEHGEPPAAVPPAPAVRRPWLPLAAVGLAVVLLAALTGLLAWQLRQQARAESARDEALAAARDAGRVLFSYDHESLEEDFAKGLALTTGDFRDEYRRTTTEVVTPVAERYDAVVVAEVVEAAVVEARAKEVVALVFLNQGTTSTRVEGQQVDQSRVRMRLVERDGRWLVEEVSAL